MPMKLITKAIEAAMPPIYATDKQKIKKVIAKFFTPDAGWTWYVFEGEKLENGDWQFFGLVDGYEGGFEKELAYFNLSQLQEIRGGMGLPVERDLHYTGEVDIETKEANPRY